MLFKKRISKVLASALVAVFSIGSIGLFNVQAAAPILPHLSVPVNPGHTEEFEFVGVAAGDFTVAFETLPHPEALAPNATATRLLDIIISANNPTLHNLTIQHVDAQLIQSATLVEGEDDEDDFYVFAAINAVGTIPVTVTGGGQVSASQGQVRNISVLPVPARADLTFYGIAPNFGQLASGLGGGLVVNINPLLNNALQVTTPALTRNDQASATIVIPRTWWNDELVQAFGVVFTLNHGVIRTSGPNSNPNFHPAMQAPISLGNGYTATWISNTQFLVARTDDAAHETNNAVVLIPLNLANTGENAITLTATTGANMPNNFATLAQRTTTLMVAGAVVGNAGVANFTRTTPGAIPSVGPFSGATPVSLNIQEAGANQANHGFGANHNANQARGFAITAGTEFANTGSAFSFHTPNPTVSILGVSGGIINVPVINVPGGITNWASVNVSGNTISNPEGGNAANFNLNTGDVIGDIGDGTIAPFAWFSHGNSRLNVTLGTAQLPGRAQAGVPRSIQINNLYVGHRNPGSPTQQENLALFLTANGQGFGNNTIAGSNVSSVAVANFVSQGVGLRTATGAAGNVQNIVSGRLFGTQALAPAPAARNNFASYAGGTVATVQLYENVALGAGGLGIAHQPWTFTLTNSEGEALSGASLAALQLTGAGFGGGGSTQVNSDAGATQFRNAPTSAAAGNTHARTNSIRLQPGGWDAGGQQIVNFTANSVTVNNLPSSGTSPQVLTLAARVSTSPTFSGPIYITATGPNGFSQTILVANAQASLNISAQTTNVALGNQITPVGSVTIEELVPGALVPGNITLSFSDLAGGVILGTDQLLNPQLLGGSASIDANGGTALTVANWRNPQSLHDADTFPANVTTPLPHGRAFTVSTPSQGQGSTINISGLQAISPITAITGNRNLIVSGTSIQATGLGDRYTHTIAIPYLVIQDTALGNLTAQVTAQTGSAFITVNGVQQAMTTQGGQALPVVNIGGRNHLPLRGVAQAFGVEPVWGWDGDTLFVEIAIAGRNVRFEQGSNVIYVNGTASPAMDATVVNVGGSTYLPFAFIGWALDIPVTWEWQADGVGQLIHFNQPNLGEVAELPSGF